MIAVILLFGLADASAPSTSPLDSVALWREHESRRFVTIPAPCLTPELLSSEIARLAGAHPKVVEVEKVGTSFLGRDIRMLSLGHGPKSILLWSQMHGDEPSATPGLLDLADFLAREESKPEIARILGAFTLRLIPMLNPDGAALYERRNAQGIDINRDARMLSTPEGRLLKSIRDRFSPILGFNLHDQGRRITVGQTGILSSISLLAVAGDAAGTMTPGRFRARRVASRVVKALSSFVPGGIARYDEDWNPRAFGDNLTAWGTPVILIESGGFPKGGGFEELTRLNFVALVSVLDGLARNDLADSSPKGYDQLLRNRADAYADVALAGVSILEPRSGRWFEADLAYDILGSDRAAMGCAPLAPRGSRIVEVGDSHIATAARRMEAPGALVAPLAANHRLVPGEIGPEVLAGLRPGRAASSEDPATFLSALHLSDEGLARNGRATFVLFLPSPSPGRYFAVIDGIGLPESSR